MVQDNLTHCNPPRRIEKECPIQDGERRNVYNRRGSVIFNVDRKSLLTALPGVVYEFSVLLVLLCKSLVALYCSSDHRCRSA